MESASDLNIVIHEIKLIVYKITHGYTVEDIYLIDWNNLLISHGHWGELETEAEKMSRLM